MTNRSVDPEIVIEMYKAENAELRHQLLLRRAVEVEAERGEHNAQVGQDGEQPVG